MKIQRVAANDLNPHFGLTLESHNQGVKDDYERRLTRLWRTGLLPHVICECMDITPDTLSSELKYLDSKGVDLTPDARTNEDRILEAKEVGIRSKHKHSDEALHRDYAFYSAFPDSISNNQIAALLNIPYSYIQRLREKTHGEAYLVNKAASIEARNQALCEEYKEREGEYGLFSKLSEKYGISRRNIDFILNEAGLRAIKAKSKEITNPTHMEIVKRFSELHSAQQQLPKEERSKLMQIYTTVGKEFNVSATFVSKLVISAGVHKSTRTTSRGDIKERNQKIISESKAREGEEGLIDKLSAEFKLTPRSIERIIATGQNKG